jgi:hypothetical protein
MGTRHITKVIKDNKVVVSQYGQWDGYPSGQGLTCYFFLQDDNNIENLRKNIKNIFYPTDEQLQEYSAPFTNENGMMDWESGKAFSEKYPSLTRDTGAEILRVIADSGDGLVPIVLDTDFENDALMCEGIYEINLDTNRFITKFDRIYDEQDDNHGEFRVVVDLHIYEDVQKIHPARYLMECNIPRLEAEHIIEGLNSRV